MPSTEVTKHLVVDLKTGFAYGLKIDADGNCTGAQPLNTLVETLEGRLAGKFGTLVGKNPLGPVVAEDARPYGQTTYAVELTKDGKEGELFTIVWPKKEDAEKGNLPIVAKKSLPEDLMKSGIAAIPKALKGQKG